LVGHTVNLLSIRVAVDEQAHWSDHVQRVKQVFLDAYDHRQFAYSNLLRKLKLKRDRSRMPLIAASFNLAQVRQPKQFLGLELEVRENPHSFTNLDIAFDFTDVAGRLE